MLSPHEWLNDWFWGVFINGFCISLLRPSIILGLFLILCFRFGSGLGIPQLFWRARKLSVPSEKSDSPRPDLVSQLFIGVGLGVLLWQLLLSGYLFEEFATNYTKDRPPFCENREPWINTKPAFGGNDHEYPSRFRYDPHGYGSMWLYGAVIGSGFAAVGCLVMLVRGVWWLKVRYDRRKISDHSCPYSPPCDLDERSIRDKISNRFVQLLTGKTPIPNRKDRVRIPYSPALPLGIILGLLAISVETRVLFQNSPKNWSYLIGEQMTCVGGWGNSEQRHESLRKRIKEKDGVSKNQETSTCDNDRKNKLRNWLKPYYCVYGAFTINFVLISLFSLILMLMPLRFRLFSPAVGIVFLLNFTLFFHVFLNYFFSVPAEFILLVAVALMLVSGRAYKLKFPNMGDYYKEPVSLEEFYRDRVNAEARLNNSGGSTSSQSVNLLNTKDIPFLDRPFSKGKSPLVIVCVSGGGSRAAAWTMKTLLEIEKAFGNPDKHFKNCQTTPAPVAFPYHVRLVTGASGGMIAAAQYVASLAEPKDPGLVQRNAPFVRDLPKGPGYFSGEPLTPDQLYDGVCQDFLTPVVHTMVTHDLLSLFSPIHMTGIDRGVTIENEWKVHLNGQLDQTFGDLRDGEKKGWRPSLIFSPMMVEDGRQLFISNLELSSVVRNYAKVLGEIPDATHPLDQAGRSLLSREGLEFFKVLPKATDFRVSTAARMSASFPYVLPAVPLPTNPPRRMVDAGYYDNFGVSIAASWLASNVEWVKENTSGVVMIQIRDGVSKESRRREEVTDPFPSVPAAAIQWATSPAEGIWSFRTASHAFRNDNLIAHLDSMFREHSTNGIKTFSEDFFTTVTFELQNGDDVSLNFCLTENERQVIEKATTKNHFPENLEALLKWWHSR